MFASGQQSTDPNRNRSRQGTPGFRHPRRCRGCSSSPGVEGPIGFIPMASLTAHGRLYPTWKRGQAWGFDTARWGSFARFTVGGRPGQPVHETKPRLRG
ncbi:predicted protein [Histoplasma mississippiense (nom. inval.)]|uniref:predicted protein n=1 Tax=Ajellomyces capsulatus (strain NAm1 / WU24) TaxID=2059318 RepID=UPI000157D645|nr:predicted protein [Histoplasma mississippiense (nom. inval.)]EDN11011.1 predicted protein [Histoplasma mississippiense (nom. inval.)]